METPTLDLMNIPPLNRRLVVGFGATAVLLGLYLMAVGGAGAFTGMVTEVFGMCVEASLLVGFLGWVEQRFREAEGRDAAAAARDRRKALRDAVQLFIERNIEQIENTLHEPLTHDERGRRTVLTRVHDLRAAAANGRINKDVLPMHLAITAPMLASVTPAALEVGPEHLKVVAQLNGVLEGIRDPALLRQPGNSRTDLKPWPDTTKSSQGWMRLSVPKGRRFHVAEERSQ